MTSALLGQENQTRLLTKSDGLPCSEVIKVFMSQEGVLYGICTNSGVFRYNGIEFEELDGLYDLNRTRTPQITQDKYGIWLDYRDNLVLIDKNDRHKVFRIKSDYWFVSTVPNQSFEYVDSDMNLFRFNGEEFIQIENRVPFISIPKAEVISSLEKNENGAYYVYTYEGQNRYKYTIDADRQINSKVNHGSDLGTRLIWEIDGRQYYGYPDIVLDNNEKRSYKEWHPERFNHILFKDDEYYGIRISPDSLGRKFLSHIFKYAGGQFNHILSFKSKYIYSVGKFNFVKDQTGVYWFGSPGGLAYVDPTVYEINDDFGGVPPNVHMITAGPEGELYLGSYTHGLFLFNGLDFRSILPDSTSWKSILPGGTVLDDGTLLFFSERKGLSALKGDSLIYFREDCREPRIECTTGYFFRKLRSGKIAAGLSSSAGIAVFNQPLSKSTDFEMLGKSKGLKIQNVLTISEDLSGNLWFGRPSQGMGVYWAENDTIINWLIEDQGDNSFGVMSSACDAAGNIWLGTTQGLKYLDRPHDLDFIDNNIFERLINVRTSPLGEQTINALITQDSFLVYGGEKYNGVINLNDFDPTNSDKVLSIPLYIGSDSEIGSTEQNCITIDKDGWIWTCHDFGIRGFRISDMYKNSREVNLELVSVQSAGLELDETKNGFIIDKVSRSAIINVRPVFNGSLHINCHIKSYVNLESGEEIDLGFSNVGEPIYIHYLPPGDHEIIIEAWINNQKSGKITIPVYVQATLTENPWFGTSTVLLTLLILGGVMLMRNYSLKRIKEKENELLLLKNEKVKFQLNSITNSLNPHFINNALNLVQIKTRKDKDLLGIVEGLSENIRIIFQNSRKNISYHSISLEFELVQNYVKIQKYRYGNQLRVQLPSEEILGRVGNYNIPLMFILIHIENAIEHGIRNREGSGQISVEIHDKDAYLEIVIEDDGCGRRIAKEIGSHGTQMGTKMLRETIDILNSYNKNKLDFIYQDGIFSENDQEYGTRVLLTIPKEYNYEF